MFVLEIMGFVVLAGGLYFVYKHFAKPKTVPQPESEQWIERPAAVWPLEVVAPRVSQIGLPAPVVTVQPSKPFLSLVVGDVITMTVYLNGVPAPVATTCQWAMDTQGIVQIAQSTTTPGLNKLTALKAGNVRLIALAGGGYSAIMAASVAAVPVQPTPNPLPFPASSSPFMLLKLLRGWLQLVHTDFNYNWDSPHDSPSTTPTAMEAKYAKMYDVSYSGSPFRWARLKKINPGIKCIPYSLELTTLQTTQGTPQIQTVWEPDFIDWCKLKLIPDDEVEMAWLHTPGGTTRTTRLQLNTWGSLRFVPDPTSKVMRDYTVDRYKRIAIQPGADGAFIDEYGSSMQNNYKLAAPTTSVADVGRVKALMDASVTLLAEIATALGATKQLIINSAGYEAAWDEATTHAAKGAHMEQTNNPITRELWANTWPYIDRLHVAGDYINMVPLYDFGHYELLHDNQASVGVSTINQALASVGAAAAQKDWQGHPVRSGDYVKFKVAAATAPVSGVNYMDTPRGKLLELASYYMVVVDPHLIGLSIENGDWAKDTPVQNYLYQINADIGLAIEIRQRVPAGAIASGHGDGTCFERRFQRGLVIANMVSEDTYTGKANWGPGNASVIALPTDRKYYRVLADGTVATTQSLNVLLRSPEAAIFVTK